MKLLHHGEGRKGDEILSMKEVIRDMVQRSETEEKEEKPPQYKGICPLCGKTLWISKSIAMEMGINTGVGQCTSCKGLLHISFNADRQEMDLELFEKYRESTRAERDVDAIMESTGYGGENGEEQEDL